MDVVLLVIHILVTLGLIGLILLQQSEGGMGNFGGGPSALNEVMTSRSAMNFITRLTSIFAVIFMSTSLLLGILASYKTQVGIDLNQMPVQKTLKDNHKDKDKDQVTDDQKIPAVPVR